MVLYGTNVPPRIGSWRSPIEEMFCAFNMFQQRLFFFPHLKDDFRNGGRPQHAPIEIPMDPGLLGGSSHGS